MEKEQQNKSNKRKYYLQNVSSSGETKPPQNFCVRRVDLRVQPQEQRYTHSYQCTVPSCIQAKVYGYQCLGFLMCAQLVETNLCRTEESNTRQYRAWLFGPVHPSLQKQSKQKEKKNEKKKEKKRKESGSS